MLQCHKLTSLTVSAPLGGKVMQAPLVIYEWREWLRPHPDRAYAEYLHHGMEEGLRVGLYGDYTCTSATARVNTTVVEEYLEKEVPLGRVTGPLKQDH